LTVHGDRINFVFMKPKAQEEVMSEAIIERVAVHMGWEKWKATLWYQTPNPMFGGTAPCKLVSMGRAHKVIKFIEYAEEDKKSFDAMKAKFEASGETPPWEQNK